MAWPEWRAAGIVDFLYGALSEWMCAACRVLFHNVGVYDHGSEFMTPIQWLGILLLLAGILGFAWYVLTDGTDPELLEEPPTMNTRNDQ